MLFYHRLDQLQIVDTVSLHDLFEMLKSYGCYRLMAKTEPEFTRKWFDDLKKRYVLLVNLMILYITGSHALCNYL